MGEFTQFLWLSSLCARITFFETDVTNSKSSVLKLKQKISIARLAISETCTLIINYFMNVISSKAMEDNVLWKTTCSTRQFPNKILPRTPTGPKVGLNDKLG